MKRPDIHEILASMAIMAGECHIGEVVELHGCRWNAVDGQGRIIGSYSDQRQAALAIINKSARTPG